MGLSSSVQYHNPCAVKYSCSYSCVQYSKGEEEGLEEEEISVETSLAKNARHSQHVLNVQFDEICKICKSTVPLLM